MIRAVVVDDEEPARRLISLRLQEERDFELVGAADDGKSALRLIQAHTPEVAFLDIRMPGLSGLDLLDRIDSERRPLIVFVTAYDSFAVEAFERAAVDYLLKPITTDRWLETLERIRARLSQEDLVHHREAQEAALRGLAAETNARATDLITASHEDGLVLLGRDEIWRVEAARNYVRLITERGVFLKRATMSGILEELPSHFVRIHRSAIVNLLRVDRVRREWHGDYTVTLKDGSEVRMSRRYADAVLRL